MMSVKSRNDNWYCEAGIGIDRSGHSPTVTLCRKPAKLYKHKGLWNFEVALCEDHKDLANATLDSHK